MKHYKKELGAVKLIGFDDCEELFEGILSQTSNKIHLLGVKHVMKNIEDWLRDTSLPSNVHRSFIEGVVGKSGLVSCRSDSEFDEMLQSLMKKWADIEIEYINDPQSKFSDYFIKNKAHQKLTENVGDKISFTGDYYQNCIEWSHDMRKSETDAGLKDSHKGATLVNAFMRIKNRNLRMYRDASKSLYGEGINELSTEYAHFQVPYEYWMTRSERERLALVSRFFTGISNTVKPANSEENRPMQVKISVNNS